MNYIKAGLAPAIAAVGLMGAQTALADPPAQPPAPLGVFGADMPAKGKFVFSFLPSATRMQDSHIGVQTVSAPYIVTHVVSPDTPVGSHLLRLVPKDLTIETEGFAVAYGLTSDLTLFASTSLIQKDVNMQAFQGLSGTTSLGYSVGSTSGLGDTTLAVIARVHHDAVTRVNVNLGLSLPTGSTTETQNLLLPNDTAPAKRAFYAMQPGSGTVDLLPGVTYSGVMRAWSWGASYRARLPLDRNAQGWAYGDLHEVNAWAGYSWAPGLETTLRLNATTQAAIQGQDPGIKGYAQGSNPQFYGGQQVGLYAGAIVSGRFVGVPSAQFGVEAGAPFYQNLNGPQLGRNWQVNFALRYKL
jgi:hypothetical protein